MRYFACPFDKILIRFLLMAAFTTGGFLSGQPLITMLAVPLFISIFLGISFMPEDSVAEGVTQIDRAPDLRKTREAA